MSLLTNSVKKYFVFILFFSNIRNVILAECGINEVKCPSGLCAGNYQQCASFISCQEGLFKCNQFTCTNQNYKCVPNSCNDQLSCWNGKCVDNITECPSTPTCPLNDDTLSVKCHDNSCVANVNSCPNYKDCPLFIPIKCTSGDCRLKISDCPSLSRCPDQFPIMCNDGSCQVSSENCAIASQQTQCVDQNLVRCSGGTCETTKFLCPTPKTCPQGFVICWDSSCAASYNKCRAPLSQQTNSCFTSNQVRCLDGSCRSNINNCPTMMVCPMDTPVRCWDNSCKESASKCPKWQDCPTGSISCNDGTCAYPKNSDILSNALCGSQITCVKTAKYKCSDNTCRRDPKDCPSIRICSSESPILCWNGKCVKNKVDCTPPDRCDIKYPVKCPDGSCKVSIESCKEILGCPIGFLQCSDGSCRRETRDCPNDDCPINFQYRCNNGICTTSKLFCDADNGCPYYTPIKCKDGSCVSDISNCITPNVPESYQRCDDGSQIEISMRCNLDNGCPIETPRLCADKSCVGSDVRCPNPSCPSTTPIKCFNGLCLSTQSSCSSITDFRSCSNLLFPCADGTCVHSLGQCKPLFPCLYGYHRCDDGSCKKDLSLCPLANTCPTNSPYRCPLRGGCAISKDYCFNQLGCPMKFPFKCANDGSCTDSLSTCEDNDKTFNVSNGCNQKNKFKCFANGRCVDTDPVTQPNICLISKCSDPAFPVFCYNNGNCADSKRNCSSSGTCAKGLIRCPDKTCTADYMLCLNKRDCPLKSPFRCLDGSCKKYPNLLINNNLSLSTCTSNIECPSYKPYLCLDGSCKEKSDFCQVIMPCPLITPYRCPNRLCYKSIDDCNNNYCNAMNPILCSNGNCVSSIFDCQVNMCPNFLPILCSDGSCVDKPSLCVYKNLLVNTPNTTGNCDENDAICYDGSCRPDISMCPIYTGCIESVNPIKCPDGTCKKKYSQCFEVIKTNQNGTLANVSKLIRAICDKNEKLCEDGICRVTCSNYNGCPNSAYLQCPNGFCVTDLSICAGISAKCPLSLPFRCIEGSCVNDILKCPNAKRLSMKMTDIVLFAYHGIELTTDIVIDLDNNIIGGISLPANLFTQENSTMNSSLPTPLVIKCVASSVLRNTSSFFNFTRKDDIYEEFNSADLNNTLSLQYEYAVLSPTLNITRLKNNSIYNSYIILSLAFDFPVKVNISELNENSTFNPSKDVCMGKLNISSNQWNCLNLTKTVSKSTQYMMNSQINSDGIYAVIFNPCPDDDVLTVEENFLLKYFKYIMIFIGVTSVVLTVGFYVFLRIYRYREKYKHTKEEELLFSIQMKEINEIGSLNLGQNLGDIMDNVFFTKNVSYKVELLDDSKISKRELEMQNVFELLSRKMRTLEGNSERLKNNHDMLITELDRLKEYHVT